MNLLSLLDQFRAMAQTGLHYADDPYDEARYERMLELIEEHYAETFELPPEEVRERLADEVGEVTPKVGAIAAVFDESERMLVIDRADGRGWCPPGGKLNLGETPEEGVVREVREETGVEAEVRELVDAYAIEPPTEFPHDSVILLYLCEAVGGEPTETYEADAVEYRHIEEIEGWTGEYHPELAYDALAVRRKG